MVNPQFRKFPQRMGYVCKNIKSFQLTQNMGIFNYMKGKIILCLKFISYMDLKKKKSLSHQVKILACVPLKVLENEGEINMYILIYSCSYILTLQYNLFLFTIS